MYGTFTSIDKYQSGIENFNFTPRDWPSYIHSSPQSLVLSMTHRINMDPKNFYLLGHSLPSSNLPALLVFSGFTITSITGRSTIYPTLQQVGGTTDPISYEYLSDQGLATSIRPIACSALLSNITPQIYQGGNLVAATVAPGVLNDWIDGSDTDLRTYEGLSKANLPKTRLMSGTAAKGAYACWMPMEDESRNFESLTGLNKRDYGGIIFNATLPNLGIPTTTNVFNLRIITVYEYQTTSRLLYTQTCKGDLDLLVQTFDAVETGGMIFENPEHMDKIRDVIVRGLFPLSNLFPGENAADRIKASFKFGGKQIQNVMNGDYDAMLQDAFGLLSL
jgi:hypothetical protein